jgi:uncharacterized protein YjlB
MTTAAPETLHLAPGETMPNSPLPVLIYRSALPARAVLAADLEKTFEAAGWGGMWRDGIYDFDHYHSNAHEVLGIARGNAVVQLGGATGQAVTVNAGDVLVLPAGTGHRRISASPDLQVVGAYPPGQSRYDICRTRSPEAELRISKVARPPSDPVTGLAGALTELWR